MEENYQQTIIPKELERHERKFPKLGQICDRLKVAVRNKTNLPFETYQEKETKRRVLVTQKLIEAERAREKQMQQIITKVSPDDARQTMYSLE